MNRFFDRNKTTILFAESWFFQLGESLFFIKQCEFSIPNPKPLPRGKGLSVGLPPSPRLGLRPKPHFQKLYRFIDSLEIIRVSGLYNVIVRRILHFAVYQVL